MSEIYDVIIAGGGPAGVLTAERLTRQNPELKIAVVEKDNIVGGRIKSTCESAGQWSYGLNSISADLFNFWDQSLKADPEATDLASLNNHQLTRIGVLAAAKFNEVLIDDYFGPKGARAIAGGAAVRDWKNVDKLKEALDSGKRKEQVFQTAWSGTRKSPAAIVLEHMARTFGIPDVWSASTSSLFEKAKDFSQPHYVGSWEESLEILVHRLEATENCDLITKSQILNAQRNEENNQWSLTTRSGKVEGRALIVAQSPWDALQWMPKSNWPTELLQMTIKGKPISVVVLSTVIDQQEDAADIDLAELTIVPAENVQVLYSKSGEICFQATIDFEISLQAPDVVKAVRRLKRARKKLVAAMPDLSLKGDHIALLPVGWSQPIGQSDRRLVSKMAKSQINSDSLMFCGDAYGPQSDYDQNFIQSITAVCDRFAAGTTKEPVQTEPLPQTEVIASEDECADN